MADPIYAQRYRHLKRLPPGRAEAAFRAQDDAGRPVAISVVRPYDPDGFLRTIGLVSAARHLSLAGVVDAGRDGADCFVVFDDPGGADAETLVARGPLPVATAALVGAQTAAGLAALHERGVVHGDVGPATVRQGADGSVKLTGAGLAGAYPAPDLAPGSPPDSARYLSPEEVAGRAALPASDVYRLGLVTYLLLTGRHAFDGADARVVAQEQLDGVVQPPQLLNPEVPPALAQIVMRALEKDPLDRGSAAQYQADIERVLSAAQVQVAPEKPRSKAWVWALGVVVVVAAALVAAWALGVFGGDTDAETVKVPDVTGMTEARAGTALEDVGLKTGKVTEVQDPSAAAGNVVAQSPKAGTEVDKGAAVELEVAGTPSPSPTATPGVAVPGVVGDSQDDAESALTGAGFTVVVSQMESDTAPAGDVIEQDPSAGVIATQGSTVRIIVSTGPATPTASPSP